LSKNRNKAVNRYQISKDISENLITVNYPGKPNISLTTTPQKSKKTIFWSLNLYLSDLSIENGSKFSGAYFCLISLVIWNHSVSTIILIKIHQFWKKQTIFFQDLSMRHRCDTMPYYQELKSDHELL
jgi:hypothetical protein